MFTVGANSHYQGRDNLHSPCSLVVERLLPRFLFIAKLILVEQSMALFIVTDRPIILPSHMQYWKEIQNPIHISSNSMQINLITCPPTAHAAIRVLPRHDDSPSLTSSQGPPRSVVFNESQIYTTM